MTFRIRENSSQLWSEFCWTHVGIIGNALGCLRPRVGTTGLFVSGTATMMKSTVIHTVSNFRPSLSPFKIRICFISLDFCCSGHIYSVGLLRLIGGWVSSSGGVTWLMGCRNRHRHHWVGSTHVPGTIHVAGHVLLCHNMRIWEGDYVPILPMKNLRSLEKNKRLGLPKVPNPVLFPLYSWLLLPVLFDLLDLFWHKLQPFLWFQAKLFITFSAASLSF